MTWLVPYLVFPHVLGVVLAFGPTFSYSIFGSFLKDEPQHRDYFARVRDKVGRTMTWPATLSMFATGALIVVVGGYQVHTQPMRWPLVSIVLYVGMVLYIRFVIDPMNQRISAMSRAARERAMAAQAAGGAPGGGAPVGQPSGGSPPGAGGPPPELLALIGRTGRDGKLLGVVVIVILFLMVVKPAFPI